MAHFNGLAATRHNFGEPINIDPQFRPYLQHNDLPDPRILAEITKVKPGPLGELHSLERDINALGIVLGSLQRKRETLNDLLSVYNSIGAPIRGLPDDALEEIFYHCLPAARNARPFLFESPLLLTLVCKKWRRIALAAPRLWSTLHLPVVSNLARVVISPHHPASIRPLSTQPAPDHFSEMRAARILALDEWLRRSGTLSLSISLHSPSVQAPSDRRLSSNDTEQILALIARYADRISALEAVTSPHVVMLLGNAIRRCFEFKKLPRLSRLRVSHCSHSLQASSLANASLSHTPMFFSAETLREVVLHGRALESDFEKYIIIRDLSPNITILSIHAPIVLHIAHPILSKLRQLERCHLSISEHTLLAVAPGQALNSGLAQIHLPALNTLSIKGTIPVIDTLCQLLDTPSLSNLQLYVTMKQVDIGQHILHHTDHEVDVDLPYPPPSTRYLSVFLSQCKSLRTLIMNPTYIQGAEMQSILSNVPHTESLIIVGYPDPHTGSSSTTARSPLPSHPTPKYSLHPLLKQQRVYQDPGETVLLDAPLLPCLTSFTWSQFSTEIPNDLLVEFIKCRLYRATHPSGAGALDGDISQKVAALKDITIRFALEGDVTTTEAKLMRHARSAGLERGSDFKLHVLVSPFILPESSKQSSQIVIPRGYQWQGTPVTGVVDSFFLENDLTWTWVDI